MNMENGSKTVKIVGRGAYGVVYLCVNPLGSNFISKHIPVSDMTTSERQSAMNEVKVLSVLSHPHVIGYYSSHIENKALVISMEYAAGGTLAEYLARQRKHIPEQEVLHKFTQICLGLEYIHSKNILHRDLKTQNILLCENHAITKIGDFGISKVLTSKSKANTVVGSPSYLSPELCSAKPYNQMSDVWALGCVLYEIMALKRAFDAPSLPQLIQLIVKGKFEPVPPKQYSSQLLFLVRCLLHVDPEKRPQPSDLLQKPMLMKHTIKLHMEIGVLPCIGTSQVVEKEDKKSRTAVKYYNLLTDQQILLPQMNGMQLDTFSLGLYTKFGVTCDGTLVEWVWCSDGEEGTYSCIPQETDGAVLSTSAGEDFIMIINENKVLYSSGSGMLGCLGHGNTSTSLTTPSLLQSLFGWEVVKVACGNQHTVVLTSENEVFTWGLGYDGRLGNGTRDNLSSPSKIVLSGDLTVADIIAGPDCSAIITSANEVYCTGKNFCNKLLLSVSYTPDEDDTCLTFTRSYYPDTLTIQKLVFSHCHAALLAAPGHVYMVGCNDEGQLGRDTDEEISPELGLLTLSDHVLDIAVTTRSTLVLTKTRTLLKLGNNLSQPKHVLGPTEDNFLPDRVHAAGHQFVVLGQTRQ